MKYFLLFFVLIFTGACSPTLRQSYSKLSPPEKTWVAFHPFRATTAYAISKEAETTKDSLGKLDIIGTDNNGGHLDAFKHSFWMARLTQGIGKRAALSLGNAHEKGNYKSYKKSSLEDGLMPDKQASEMDLFNNSVGNEVGKYNRKASKAELIQSLLDSLQSGKLRVLLKDNAGNFLDCQKQRIPIDSLKNRWDTKKCLVPSNI